MCPGLTADLLQINDAHTTAIIDRELSRLNVDIACLLETRLADNGNIREASYTFFWQRKSSDEPRQHGVGFTVKNTLVAFIEPPSTGTENTCTSPVNILWPSKYHQEYALTLCSNSEEKDQLYTQKNKGLKLYLLGYNCHGLSRNEGSRRRSVLSNSLYWEY